MKQVKSMCESVIELEKTVDMTNPVVYKMVMELQSLAIKFDTKCTPIYRKIEKLLNKIYKHESTLITKVNHE